MDSFQKFPDNARIWVYASNRILNQEEEAQITRSAASFLSSWTAHDIPVDATVDLLHHCFVVIAANVDTSDISGCGIDKSVAFIKALGQEMNLDFFDRMQIEVMIDQHPVIGHKKDIAQWVLEGKVNADTLTFNKTIIHKKDFVNGFQIPVSSSWFSGVLKPVSIHE